jgi:hypothetical protein
MCNAILNTVPEGYLEALSLESTRMTDKKTPELLSSLRAPVSKQDSQS